MRRVTCIGLVVLATLLPALARAGGAAASGADPAVVALAVALATTNPAAARPAAPRAEVELSGTVEAEALVFEDVPRVELAAHDGAARRATWTAERVNLPERPTPGVVYRNVRIRFTVTGPMDAIDALLADARRAATGVRIEPAAPSPTARTWRQP